MNSLNFIASETQAARADLKRRPFDANWFRELCGLAAELTRSKHGVRLTNEERETLRVAREYLDIVLKNDEYWKDMA